MKHIDSYTHTRGESIYLDDIPMLQGTLFAAVFGSPLAHGKIINLDLTGAIKLPGVVRIFTSKDVPGKNQIGGIVADEPLLAKDTVHYRGMPVALVIAQSKAIAAAAIKLITIQIEPLPIITNPRIAMAQGELIVPPRTFKAGDTSTAWANCTHIAEGKAETNGQEHLYIETQGAYAMPLDNDSIKIFSSTQGPTAVQRHAADVLGIGMHRIEVDVTRIGGGFGGKEDQANSWAVMCAMAALLLQKPVKYALDRSEDMRMTGKRNPYSADFKIGLDDRLKILAYEVTFYQNAGAAADLSPAVMERTLFHCTNSYYIPNVLAKAYSCRTNLPPNTAFRGFGAPQGMFVIESAIHTIAEQLQIPAWQIQQQNLLETGDQFHYGQQVQSEAGACWQKACSVYDLDGMRDGIDTFNANNISLKKGLSLMPVCFGISFTKTFMNQSRALVHVYTDGSVGVSTGAVEMGQGVNTKMVQIAAAMFSIQPSRVKLYTTNTTRIANTSPSAASATADLNGRALQMACENIISRLKMVAAEIMNTAPEAIRLQNEMVWADGMVTELSWTQLVTAAFVRRVALSEHAHYATPGVHFDASKEKGNPFAYHVFGTAITEVTIDCMRGTYHVNAVKIVHDAGSSMNETIDRGQIEGGLLQGIGWMTMEEIIYDADGRLRSEALSTYKVPDIYAAPSVVDIRFLQTDKDSLAVLRSKAVGEPPLMYGLGTYFALHNAIKAYHPEASITYAAPMTPEKVLMSLYVNNTRDGEIETAAEESMEIEMFRK